MASFVCYNKMTDTNMKKLQFIDGISISDVDAFRHSVVTELKNFGVKLTKDKPKEEKPLKSAAGTVFGNDLSNLPLSLVRQNESSLEIPSFLVNAFAFIGSNIDAEGIFRKAGSVQRQREIKKQIENNGTVEGGDVHDVANIVKQFLRGLPTPLINVRLRELMLKAFDAGNHHVIPLLCALMPMVHLHTLRYVMMFFNQVSEQHESNKMNSHNLAVVLTPNLFTVNSTSSKDKGNTLQRETALVQWMIENAYQIGFVSEHLISQFNGFNNCILNDINSSNKKSKRNKKRNSINGMLQGFRKMVQTNKMLSAVQDGKENSAVDESKKLSAATKTTLNVPTTVKRRSVESDNSSIPIKSPRHESVESKVKHMDSPALTLIDEMTISTNPETERTAKNIQPESSTRLSTRYKFFGKGGYLKRRNSLSISPKPTKVCITKKTCETTQVQRIKKRFQSKNEKLASSSPSLPNMRLHLPKDMIKTKLASPKPVEVVQQIDIEVVMENEENVVPSMPSASKLKKRKSTTNDNKKYSSDDNLSAPKMRRTTVKRAVSDVVSISDNPLMLPLVIELKTAAKNKKNEEHVEAAEFVKPIQYNRSLRRGRPNTVNSGLPVESKKEIEKVLTHVDGCLTSDAHVENINSHLQTPRLSTNSFPAYPPIDGPRELRMSIFDMPAHVKMFKALQFDPVKQALNFDVNDDSLSDAKQLPKSDSGVFAFEEVKEEIIPVDFSEEADRAMNPVEFSFDSGIDRSHWKESDETGPKAAEGVAGNLRRKSISMSDIRDNVHSFRKNNRNSNSSENLKMVLERDVEWESASVFMMRELKNETKPSSGLGRPSIVQLLKEKSGTVSATAKQYDAISCGGGNSPIGSGQLITSCPRMNPKEKNFSPIKIPSIFATPCADRTNSPQPVFKTPLAYPRPLVKRVMKENSLTPKRRSSGCKERNVRRSNSVDKCKSSISLRRSSKLPTSQTKNLRRRLSSSRKKISASRIDV